LAYEATVRAVFVTHVELTGTAPIVAELVRPMPGEPPGDRVRLYLGDGVIVTMPLVAADSLGDALAAVEDTVITPKAASW
jgi:hypothetical protein